MEIDQRGWKSQPCSHFLKTGRCKFGKQCKFEHEGGNQGRGDQQRRRFGGTLRIILLRYTLFVTNILFKAWTALIVSLVAWPVVVAVARERFVNFLFKMDAASLKTNADSFTKTPQQLQASAKLLPSAPPLLPSAPPLLPLAPHLLLALQPLLRPSPLHLLPLAPRHLPLVQPHLLLLAASQQHRQQHRQQHPTLRWPRSL